MTEALSQADIERARKRSVTADDVIPAIGGGAFTVLLGPVGLLSSIPGIAQHGQFGLPGQGTLARDRLLSSTPAFETMWSALIFKLVSKKIAQGFRIEDADDSQRRIKAAQQLVLGYDGSYASGLQRGLQDYLLTDMGMVVEKARQSSARGSKIAGLFHLDALRCYPTGDPNKPIVYWSTYGGYHLMDAEDVIRITDMPSPRVELRGYGMCAGSRAWAAIIGMAAVRVYFREKITGTRNLAIHIVNGISDKQMRDALNTSEDARESRGFVLYKGSTIIPMTEMAATPTVVTIPLAEIPDGFDVEQVTNDTYRQYAHSAGANVEDFVPAPAGLNTGLTAQIKDEGIAGQGMAAFDKNWELALTHTVMPGSTTFYMGTGEDWRDQEMKAKAQKARADTLAVYVTAGAISPLQMLNAAVDSGDLDAAFLPEDQTEAGTVDDNQKLIAGEAQATIPVLTPTPSNTPQAQSAQQAAPGGIAQRRQKEMLALLKQAQAAEWEEAVERTGEKRTIVDSIQNFMADSLAIAAKKDAAPDEWEEAVKWAEEAQTPTE